MLPPVISTRLAALPLAADARTVVSVERERIVVVTAILIKALMYAGNEVIYVIHVIHLVFVVVVNRSSVHSDQRQRPELFLLCVPGLVFWRGRHGKLSREMVIIVVIRGLSS